MAERRKVLGGPGDTDIALLGWAQHHPMEFDLEGVGKCLVHIHELGRPKEALHYRIWLIYVTIGVRGPMYVLYYDTQARQGEYWVKEE